MQNNILEYSIDHGFQIAKKRSRIIAFSIDVCIFCILGMALGIFFGKPVGGIIFGLQGTPALAMAFIAFFLWPMSEGIWGQTLGKRMLDIKVITDHYEPIDITASITRYVLSFLDYVFLIGFIVAANNKMNKRIGDIAANTIVVQI